MDGQWHGLVGGGTGYANIEIDDCGAYYQGRAHLYDPDVGFVVVAAFRTPNKATVQSLPVRIEYQPIGIGAPIPVATLQEKYPQGVFPQDAILGLRLIGKGLAVSVTLSQGTPQSRTVKATLPRSGSEKKSRLPGDKSVKSWSKFKAMVGEIPMDKYIFRGQPVTNRLRSSFHRTNRKDLHRYVNVDIPNLHKILSSSTRHFFNLADETQNAAFWNLLQHHGYPTPLLDWTHSPYVAAYFAFRRKIELPDPNQKVRIFMFDAKQWKADLDQLKSVVNVRPHFSLLEAIALENPRALPQQALSAITTVDDIEGYLQQKGNELGKAYLRVFDLPYAERESVMNELRLMGISAGALFPGIDGACEEMRVRMFAS